jgi:hypothetical protein
MNLFVGRLLRGPQRTRLEESMIENMDNTAVSEPLYRHLKRAEWGLGILAWEQPTKRGYQFQDGVLRIIDQGYYDLLRKVNHPPEGATALVADLRSRAKLVVNREYQVTRAKEPGLSFAEQLQIFRVKFPHGFADEKWLSSIRGVGTSRRLKRHRQPAIDQLRGEISDEALQQALDHGRSAEVVDTIVTLISRTNLVKAKELGALRELSAEQHTRYVAALRELLFGDAPLEQRFDGFAAAQGKRGTWQQVTAPAALVQPESGVCVHPTMFRRQARVLEPALSVSAGPMGRVYVRLAAMVGRIGKLLVEASLPPADLMDIFDFMGITLLPSARKLLKD